MTLFCDNCGDETSRRFLCPCMCRRLVCYRCEAEQNARIRLQQKAADAATARVTA